MKARFKISFNLVQAFGMILVPSIGAKLCACLYYRRTGEGNRWDYGFGGRLGRTGRWNIM